MTLESKENYPRHTKTVQNSLGFMPEVKPLHKPCGDLVLCAQKMIHFDTTSRVNMILRWRYDRFIYGAIIELLCHQCMLHVQYISVDDLVITST